MPLMGDAPQVLLDPEVAAFIQGGVSVVIAARNAELVPDVVRGCGCRVSRDRGRVTVLVESGRAEVLLADIRATRKVAVVFSQPSTHRTIQLKGDDAAVVPFTAADRPIAERHLLAWVAELVSAGFDADFAATIHGRAERNVAAIRFTPTSAFEQTPGPAAGQRLGAMA
jgi:hypothetical protein